MSNQLTVLVKPYSSGTCPAIYKDAQDRLFIQGNKLTAASRQSIAVADHEEVVEISGDLLDFLRSL